MGALLAVVFGGLFCLNLLVMLVLGWVFPGMQYSYSSDSKILNEFNLVVENGPQSVRIQVPDDYVSALVPGPGGYDEVELTVYLPDMISEPDYYKLHPELDVPGPMPQSQLDQRLVIEITESYEGSDDPTGIHGWVESGIHDAETANRPLAGNLYSRFNAYIWTESGADRIDGAVDTETDYIPKADKNYYIICRSEESDDADCYVKIIFEDKLELSIDMSPYNLLHVDKIIRDVEFILKNSMKSKINENNIKRYRIG